MVFILLEIVKVGVMIIFFLVRKFVLICLKFFERILDICICIIFLLSIVSFFLDILFVKIIILKFIGSLVIC